MPTSRFFTQFLRSKPIFIFCLILIFALPLVWGWQSLRAAKVENRQLSASTSKLPTAGYHSSTGRHKVRVTDSRIAEELKQLGADLVADYGAFQVFSADETVTAAIRQSNGKQRDGLNFSDEDNLVLLNAGALDTTNSELQQQRKNLSGKAKGFNRGEASLHLVQFAGPIKPTWYAALEATGVKVVNYIPNNAYLVYGDDVQLTRLSAWASRAEFVQWDGEYKSEYKIDPAILARLRGDVSFAEESELMAIQLVADESGNQTTKQLIESLKGEPIRSQYDVLSFTNIIVKLPIAASNRQLAARPDVVSITRYIVPEKFDERQNVILSGNLTGNNPTTTNYLTYLNSQGFTQSQFDASGFGVHVVDSGIDNATTTPNHFALYVSGITTNASRVAFNRLEGTPNGANSTLQGCDGHGNINAHIIGGFIPTGSPFDAFPHADASGFRYGLGVAPFVRLGSTVVFDPNTWTFPSLPAIESRAYNDNSRISSNSWGSNVGGAYTVDSQAYDALVRDAQPTGAPFVQAGNQEMVIVFSAGNQGPSASTIGAPGTAKNVITVGAAENVQALGGSDACGISDASANSANDMANFSSRGPTTDGRNKPEIVAPGTHITGGVAQAANPPSTGQGNPCYTGGGVCGGVSGADYFPTGQQFYTASSGTSHSAPAVAGAAALLRQRFLNASLAAPSPAMTKAVLMNSARYMNGTNANDSLWSNVQGMGEVNLTTAFDLFSTPSVLRDQIGADTFTATGQSQIFTGSISNVGQPFRVTLAWTDAPGSTTGNAFVNNLDLEVTVGGQTYKGNVFTGASSVTGGVADTRNNAESVFIPAGVSGSFTVKIIATNIAGDGVPNSGGALDQDFALVISNAVAASQAVIAPSGSAITAESCLPADGAIDPAETVTVNLSLQNVGNLNTTNLVATLQATGGVNSPSGAQNYGALTFGGASVSMPFTFTASGACGETITATLTLQDGVTNLGTATYTFRLGTSVLASSTSSNTTSINIPSGAPATTVGNASPYPSQITTSGLSGTISKVTVTLNGLNHTFPDDLDILLVGPGGQKVMLMSDAGGATDIVNSTLTFDDTGAAIPNSSAITGGTYSPANYDGEVTDTFSSPAPAGPYSTQLSAFVGGVPNGTWSLFVTDDADSEVGSMTGGWSLTITTSVPGCCSGSCPTITVSPSTIPNGIVGKAYSQQFTQTGGTNPVFFNAGGTLPPGLTLSASGLLSGAPTAPGTFSFSVQAISGNTCIGVQSVTLDVTRLQFYPLASPIRLLDTRANQANPGCDAPNAPITGNTSRTQTARRTCAGQTIPANAMAITGNITTVQSGGGYLTLYPSDVAQPYVANSNYTANEVINNVFTVGLGEPDGAFKIFVTTTTDVVVDVTGYYAPPTPSGLYFHPLPKPIRLLETRANFTGCNATGTPIPATTDTTLSGYLTCDSVTIPNTARALVGNATVIAPTNGGFMTLFPADVGRPFVSNSNFVAGQTMNAPFTVGLSNAGQFNVYSTSTTDLAIDVLGYFSADATDVNGAGLFFTPLPRPVRLFESRPNFSGCTAPAAALVAGTTYTQNARGTCDGMTVDLTALAIVGNATVVSPSAQGYLTFWPSSAAQPNVATSNYASGQAFNRHFIVGLGAGDGAFKMFSQRNTHLVIDLSGYFAP